MTAKRLYGAAVCLILLVCSLLSPVAMASSDAAGDEEREEETAKKIEIVRAISRSLAPTSDQLATLERLAWSDDPILREWAVGTLGQFGVPEAGSRRAVFSRLVDDDWGVALVALRGLEGVFYEHPQRIVDGATVCLLARAQWGEKGGPVILVALELLRDRSAVADVSVSIVGRMLTSESGAIRRGAAEVLAAKEVRDRGLGVPLLRMLDSGEAASSAALGRLASHDLGLAEEIAKRLGSTDGRVRAAALQALGRIRGRRMTVEKELLKSLDGSAALERLLAARAVGAIASPDVAFRLLSERLHKEPEASVRAGLVTGLSRVGTVESARALSKLLGTEESARLRAAVYAGMEGPYEFYDVMSGVLMLGLADQADYVRMRAARTILRWKGKNAGSKVWEVIEELGGSPNSLVRLHTVDALATRAGWDKSAVKLLEGKLADEFLEVRVRASKALLDLGKDGNGIEDCAVSGLLSEDSRVRRWGLEVLLRLGTRARGSVSKVEAIATEDPDRELRQLARWTLARLR